MMHALAACLSLLWNQAALIMDLLDSRQHDACDHVEFDFVRSSGTLGIIGALWTFCDRRQRCT